MWAWAEGVARDGWVQGRTFGVLGKPISGDPLTLPSYFPSWLVNEVGVIQRAVAAARMVQMEEFMPFYTSERGI